MKDEIIKVIKIMLAINILSSFLGVFCHLKKTFFLKIFKNDMMKKGKLKKNDVMRVIFF